MSSSTDSRGMKPQALLALLSAVVVAAVAAGTLFAPDSFRDPAGIAAPALAALVVIPFLALRLIIQPLRRDSEVAEDQATTAERALSDERHERTVLRELDRALDQAATEKEAIDTIRAAFNRHLSTWSVELHLVHATDPILTVAVAAGGHEVQPSTLTSPWEALAARTNTTLVYDTTDRLDVCAHLKTRVSQPVAAVAVPLNATGRLLGVLYCMTDEGTQIEQDEVEYLEDVAAVLAARIAVLRSVGHSSRADAVDRLTGLPDRGAMQERLLRLLQERQSFSVAVADIDQFGSFNETQGREAGDDALRTLAQVARRCVRPADIVGRIGGDELLFIFPRTQPDDATRALERLREELVLSQSTIDSAPFTLSIGVIGSSAGNSIEEILHRAAGALNHAKTQGGNRVVVAQSAPRTTGD